MERQKRNTQKRNWFRAAVLIAVGGLIAVSCILCFVPNGWRSVFQAAGLGGLEDRAADAPFALYLLDVGKADAMVVVCDGHAMVVDCGNDGDGRAVARCLGRMDIDTVDYAVATHPDRDHIGGYPELLEQVSVGTFAEPMIAPALLEGNGDYQQVEDVLSERLIQRKILKAGHTFSLGEAQVQVLAPAAEMDSTNNSSLVLRITYGETAFLLMGDCEASGEEQLLASGADLTADVLKVGHHGSDTSTTEALVQAVTPAYGLISVGPDRNDLPKDAVLRRLQTSGTEVYRTDREGDLLAVSYGTAVTIVTEK